MKEHELGDTYYRIITADFKPEIRECSDDPVVVKTLKSDSRDSDNLTATYYTKGGVELHNNMARDGKFWTRKEAEDFLFQNALRKQTFTDRTPVFFIQKKCDEVRLCKTVVDCLMVKNGKFRYSLFAFHERYYIAEEDIGKTVFLNYADAKTARDKYEEKLWQES